MGHEMSSPESATAHPYRRAIEMAWQIAVLTPRCFEGIFTLSGSGSPGLYDLIPSGNVLTLKCLSRCPFSVAASISPPSVPFPIVDDLLVLVGQLGPCREDDLP